MLTEQKVAWLKPGAVPREIAESKVPGCYFMLHPSGAASWTLRYKFQIRRRKFTLGKYPAVSRKAARQLAGKSIIKFVLGVIRKPKRKPTAWPSVPRARRSGSRRKIAAQYVKLYAGAPAGATAHETQRLLEKEIIGTAKKPGHRNGVHNDLALKI